MAKEKNEEKKILLYQADCIGKWRKIKMEKKTMLMTLMVKIKIHNALKRKYDLPKIS